MINLVPTAKNREWESLGKLLKAIMDDLDLKRSDPEFADGFLYGADMEEQLVAEYKELLSARVPAKFRSFVLSVQESTEEVGAYLVRELEWIRSERRALYKIIDAAQYDDSNGWVSLNMRKQFDIRGGLLVDSDRVHAVEIILDQNVPIGRLNICSSCPKIYWQKYRGSARKSETCGSRQCSNWLANWKRKNPRRETHFRFIKESPATAKEKKRR